MSPRDIHSLEGLVMIEDATGYIVDTLAHHLIDGVYSKVFVARRAGTFIGQHSHVYDHGHLVASGEVRLFVDDKEVGDFSAGAMILIEAGKKHVLLALENNTMGVCIHNVHGEMEPAIKEEAVLGR